MFEPSTTFHISDYSKKIVVIEKIEEIVSLIV